LLVGLEIVIGNLEFGLMVFMKKDYGRVVFGTMVFLKPFGCKIDL
jgi:hypothetical protein